MSREMDHIEVLAGEIGFRVATTEGEQHAANYIEQEMHSYGLQEIRQEPFPCATESMSGVFPYMYTALGSSLIAPLTPLLGLTGLLATPATLTRRISHKHRSRYMVDKKRHKSQCHWHPPRQ